MNVACTYCGVTLDPTSRSVYRRVVGWERIAGRRVSGKHGGSDISLREPRDQWACTHCIDRLRSGVAIEQGSLL